MIDRRKTEELEKLIGEFEQSAETDIPEPDWLEFRLAVRDRLLSRSVQRQSAVRRWTGWPIQPAMAWALSLFFAVGITTAVFLWNTEQPTNPVLIQRPFAESAMETAEVESEIAVWSQSAVFDELGQLGDAEEAQLRRMLESAQKGTQERE